MPITRHATLAQAIVTHLDATWSDKPASASIVRAYNYEHLIKDLSDDDESVIAVITPQISTESQGRAGDRDTLPVFVCVLASLADSVTATIDAWDVIAESCRDTLRSHTLKAIDLGSGVTARRVESAELPTPYDADYLDGSNLFFALIEMEYTIFVEVAA